ncbi:MAG: cyclodehydratase, partial [Mycobacterium sp.]
MPFGATVTRVALALDPVLPVLLRPDGAVQIGWDPRRAVLVRPPAGLSAPDLAFVLRAMTAPQQPAALHRLA